MKRAGGKLRSLQKNQSVFFDHLPISAFVRSDVLCHFVGIQSGYLLSYSVVRHNDNFGTIFMNNPWLLRKSQNYQYF